MHPLLSNADFSPDIATVCAIEDLYMHEYATNCFIYTKDRGANIIHRLEGPAIPQTRRVNNPSWYINNVKLSQSSHQYIAAAIRSNLYTPNDIQDMLNICTALEE